MSEISSNLKLVEDAIKRGDLGHISSFLASVKGESAEQKAASLKTMANLAYKAILYDHPTRPSIFDLFYEHDKAILTTPINGNGNSLLQNLAKIETADGFKKVLGYMKKDGVSLSHLNNYDWNVMHTLVNIDVVTQGITREAVDDARNKINEMISLVFSADPEAFIRMCEKANKAEKRPMDVCKEETTYSHIINIAKGASEKIQVGAILTEEVRKFDEKQNRELSKMLQSTFRTEDQNSKTGNKTQIRFR
ncbi:MAG: hypothetical protein KGH65_02350 [Candidatus Micrarchaeota archaeon]|nr:hypothetical protein [Candidatus Micrarchaeota archaeon]